MIDDSPHMLQQVSVVVTAEYHNPSILNPDFLVSREIVPGSWNVIESLTTPAASVVRYDNGVHWVLDKQKLNVIHTQGARFPRRACRARPCHELPYKAPSRFLSKPWTQLHRLHESGKRRPVADGTIPETGCLASG